ncbi:MAG: S8 family serine peptidase [Phycisphaerales bacterium]|nr:S8 family serine peptidase [Phycisphaerales bacterium]
MYRLLLVCVAAVAQILAVNEGVHASPHGEAGESLSRIQWVIFTDKGITSRADLDAALARVAATADPRTIARRQARRTLPGLFDERDVPVVDGYVDAVRETGARVRVTSKWVNAVSVEATAEQLAAIERLPFVKSTQPVARSRRIEPRIAPAPGQNPAGFYGLAEGQLAQINLIELHGAGYTGRDVRIGVLDTGFLRTHDAFNHPEHSLNVVAEWDFVFDDPNTANEAEDHPDQHNHGTIILGTLGAYLPGEYVGGAYDASFILCKTEDIRSETPVEEDYYVAGLEFIEANGGDMATASLIYIDWYTQEQLDGRTAVCTIGVNIATGNGVHCCNAAGNMGHDQNPNTSHLGAPADAFQVITCGAVEPTGEIAGFSSDGPTADGRAKPEVLARGTQAYSVAPWDNHGWVEAAGTSMSTPQVAAAVACLIDARPNWSVDQLRDGLLTTADYYIANGTFDPLHVHGYGIINAHAALGLLRLDPPVPGTAGVSNTLTARDAEPGSRVYFVYSFSTGSTSVPNCPGVEVELRQPIIAGSVVADGNGTAQLVRFVPGAASGRTVHIQAVDAAACRTSNHVVHQFP